MAALKAMKPRLALNEEIEFFRDFCGWSEHRIERRLGLYEGTLAQRRRRAERRKAKLETQQV